MIRERSLLVDPEGVPRDPVIVRSAGESFRLALRPSTVKRALKYAVVVGIILISINHGDALLNGDFSRDRLFKMALTLVVPYVVSTLSSVGAMREKSRAPDN